MHFKIIITIAEAAEAARIEELLGGSGIGAVGPITEDRPAVVTDEKLEVSESVVALFDRFFQDLQSDDISTKTTAMYVLGSWFGTLASRLSAQDATALMQKIYSDIIERIPSLSGKDGAAQKKYVQRASIALGRMLRTLVNSAKSSKLHVAQNESTWSQYWKLLQSNLILPIVPGALIYAHDGAVHGNWRLQASGILVRSRLPNPLMPDDLAYLTPERVVEAGAEVLAYPFQAMAKRKTPGMVKPVSATEIHKTLGWLGKKFPPTIKDGKMDEAGIQILIAKGLVYADMLDKDHSVGKQHEKELEKFTRWAPEATGYLWAAKVRQAKRKWAEKVEKLEASGKSEEVEAFDLSRVVPDKDLFKFIDILRYETPQRLRPRNKPRSQKNAAGWGLGFVLAAMAQADPAFNPQKKLDSLLRIYSLDFFKELIREKKGNDGETIIEYQPSLDPTADVGIVKKSEIPEGIDDDFLKQILVDAKKDNLRFTLDARELIKGNETLTDEQKTTLLSLFEKAYDKGGCDSADYYTFLGDDRGQLWAIGKFFDLSPLLFSVGIFSGGLAAGSKPNQGVPVSIGQLELVVETLLGEDDVDKNRITRALEALEFAYTGVFKHYRNFEPATLTQYIRAMVDGTFDNFPGAMGRMGGVLLSKFIMNRSFHDQPKKIRDLFDKIIQRINQYSTEGGV